MLRRRFGTYGPPWQEMERMRREMNRLFGGMAPHRTWPVTSPGFPAANVWSNPDGAVVTAEMPGVNPEDIDISVVGDTLTVSGNREPDQPGEGATYHRRERRHGRFSRAYQLPFEIDSNQVEATYEKGVLHISLPRAQEEKPQRIAVKSA
jgi:HSP20 family protein